jgi:HK97 gp10 family phage protein
MSLQNRDRFLKKLAAIQGAPRKAMREALRKNAEELSDMQRRMAPVASGDLKRSIGYTFGDYRAANANVRGVGGGGAGDPDLTVTVHAGDEKAFYAAFIEFGTKGPYKVGGKFAGAMHPGITAQPFFYPSYRALKRRMKSRLTRSGRKAIREAAKG